MANLVRLVFLVTSLIGAPTPSYATTPWEQSSREIAALKRFDILFQKPKSGPPPRMGDAVLTEIANEMGEGHLRPATYAALIELMQRGTGAYHAKVRQKAAEIVMNGAKEGWLDDSHLRKLLEVTPILDTKSSLNEAAQAVAQAAHRRVGRMGDEFTNAAISALEKVQLFDRSGAPNPAMNLAAENLLYSLDRESLSKNLELKSRLKKWIEADSKERLRYVLAGESRLIKVLDEKYPLMSSAEMGQIAERSIEVRRHAMYGTKSLTADQLKLFKLTAEHDAAEIMNHMYSSNSEAALNVVEDLAREVSNVHSLNGHAAMFAKLQSALESLSVFRNSANRDAVLRLLDAARGIDYDFEREAISHLISNYSEEPIVQRKLMEHLGSTNQMVRELSRRALAEIPLAAGERNLLRETLVNVSLRPGDDEDIINLLRKKAAKIGLSVRPMASFDSKPAGCIVEFASFKKSPPSKK